MYQAGNSVEQVLDGSIIKRKGFTSLGFKFRRENGELLHLRESTVHVKMISNKSVGIEKQATILNEYIAHFEISASDVVGLGDMLIEFIIAYPDGKVEKFPMNNEQRIFFIPNLENIKEKCIGYIAFEKCKGKFYNQFETFTENVEIKKCSEKKETNNFVESTPPASEVVDMGLNEDGIVCPSAGEEFLSNHKISNNTPSNSYIIKPENIDSTNKLKNEFENQGINIYSYTFLVPGYQTLPREQWDWTDAINAAIDYAQAQTHKVKFEFPTGKYRYSGSKIIDATKVYFVANGSVTFDVTESVSMNAPYIFNFQNTKVNSNEMNWNHPVFDGFNFETTLSEEAVKSKNTVLFLFETPKELSSEGNNTHNSANVLLRNITGRLIPYFYLFGSSAFLIRIENLSHRLCKTVIKVLHPNDAGVLNTEPDSSGRINYDYGENITFIGGMIGGAWETCIYNKLQAGSLNFKDISIDYWYGGTFLTVGHNGVTNFETTHIEAAHNKASLNNEYNKSNPDIKWWISMEGSHMLNFSKVVFYAGNVVDRDTTDLESLIKSTSGSCQVNFSKVTFVNLKFTRSELIQGRAKYTLKACGFTDSLPFFMNLSEKNDNLLFNRRYEDIQNIKGLPSVSCPYPVSAPLTNLTDQWTNSTVKVEWDNTEKAFKITKLNNNFIPTVTFSYNVTIASGVMPITLDIKASGSVSGKITIKLRGGQLKEHLVLDGSLIKKYYENIISNTEYVTDIVPLSNVPLKWTSYFQTVANGYINKLPRLKSYIIEVDVKNLNDGEAIYVRNLIVQAF
ncbi:hypothetical protein [Priestia sp. TGN 0903]|uniref:hypothetical protein n=1 Tax=Priestia sp. TGN 0903 TaxID=3420730 RepID=UPI003D789AF2